MEATIISAISTDSNSTETVNLDYLWNDPYLIDTIVNEDSVELIYRQSCKFQMYPMSEPDKIFKIICSCQKGRWHKERVEGTIIPKSDEHYVFNK